MTMRTLFLALPIVAGNLIFSVASAASPTRLNDASRAQDPSHHWILKNLDFAAKQYKYFALKVGLENALFPRSLSAQGDLSLVPAKDWTSGFFPGGLWYLYEYSKDNTLKEAAEHFTHLLEDQSRETDNHDVGFIMMSSYGHAHRLTQNDYYKQKIIETSHSLATRFNSVVGCTRSWDFGTWKFPVIIDNVMNMELLYWSARESSDQTLGSMANAHMDTTLSQHFRPDGSSFHLVDYDPSTGAVLKRQTVQGYRDDSAWSRGQGWALYGYTMGYRFTKNPAYLAQAEKIADFILGHLEDQRDFVPPWDFDVPGSIDAQRDSSAGAIYASAFYELATFLEEPRKTQLISAGDTLLKSLSSPSYRAQETGDYQGFLLTHGVGWMAGRGDVDRPLIYGDYYYIEALVRRWRLLTLGSLENPQ